MWTKVSIGLVVEIKRNLKSEENSNAFAMISISCSHPVHFWLIFISVDIFGTFYIANLKEKFKMKLTIKSGNFRPQLKKFLWIHEFEVFQLSRELRIVFQDLFRSFLEDNFSHFHATNTQKLLTFIIFNLKRRKVQELHYLKSLLAMHSSKL